MATWNRRFLILLSVVALGFLGQPLRAGAQTVTPTPSPGPTTAPATVTFSDNFQDASYGLLLTGSTSSAQEDYVGGNIRPPSYLISGVCPGRPTHAW